MPTPTERRHTFRKYGVLLYLVLLLAGTTALLYIRGNYVQRPEPRQLGIEETIFLGLSINFITTGLIFIIVDLIFSYNPPEEQQQVIDKALNRLSEITREAEDKIRGVEMFENRVAMYDAGIRALQEEEWDRVRVYAPVGFWRQDEKKKEWLIQLAEHTKPAHRSVNSVWAVFGLPPMVLNGNVRQQANIAIDLAYARKLLTYFESAKNTELHYFPPMHASVGIGAIIFENLSRDDGLVVFGLTSREQEDVVDIGFVVRNEELFKASRLWFDEKIWSKATGRYILQA